MSREEQAAREAECKAEWMAQALDVRERARPGDFETFRNGYLAARRHGAARVEEADRIISMRARIEALNEAATLCELVDDAEIDAFAAAQSLAKAIRELAAKEGK